MSRAAQAIGDLFSSEWSEALAALSLAKKLEPSAKSRDLKQIDAALDANWRDVYGLADKVADRHMRTGKRASFMEPIVERLQPAATHFDADWKDKVVTVSLDDLDGKDAVAAGK